MSRKPTITTNTTTSHTHLPFDDIASNTVLKEVKTAIENINLNVGEIVVGDISVQSDDVGTHERLDTLNNTVSNKHLNSVSDSVSVVGSVDVNNFPATQAVSGTVAVSNTSFEVSNFPATQTVNGSVSVSNFPATQAVSGTVAVSNTSFEVSNFPTTQAISGTVAVSSLPSIGITNTSFEVSNFPATQDVSGTVAVSSLPSIGITNTSFEVSNFPTTQPISGSVSISNLPATQPVSGTVAVSNTSFEVSNFPATQPISGSVSVSNLPATQPVSGTVAVSSLPAIGITNTSFEVSNFPATQPVSGTVAISNTSFEVSNFPATQPVSGTVAVSNTSFEVSNFPATQPVSGTVAISSLPAIGITNTSFEVSNFPTTQPISGSVSVSNLPATQPVSGTVAVSTLPAIGITNTSFEVSNFPATQPVSGTVAVSTLPAIGITNTSFEVSNFPATQPVSGSVSVSNFPATQPVSGTVTVNTISGFSLDTTTQATNTKLDTIHADLDGLTFDGSSNLNVNIASGSISVSSVNIKDSAGNNLNSVSGSLNSNITNTSIDVHNYASSNGTTWHHLSCDGNGQLNVHSKMQDGAGTDLTSTLIGAKQSLDVNVANTVPVSGSFATETTLGTTNTKLDTINTSVGTVNTSVGTTNTKLDTINTSVGTGNTSLSSIDGKVPSGLTVSASRLLSNSQASAFNVNSANVQNLTCVAPTGTVNTQALHTYSYGAGYWDVSGSYVPFNMSLVSDKYCLNVYDVPKVTKEYTFGGTDFNGTAYRLIGGLATSSGLALDAYNYGLANPRTYWASLNGGAPNNNLYIDYVDGTTGDLVESAVAFPVVNTVDTSNWTLLPNMIGPPIKFRTSGAVGNVANTGYTLYISPITNTNRGICAANIANYCVGVFTIPNGYIGYISNISAGFSAAGSLIVCKWGTDGVRQVVHKFNIESSLNVVISSGYEGTIGGLFVAGESVGFTHNQATPSKTVMASMTLRKI